MTPVHLAARHGHISVINEFVKEKVKRFIRNKNLNHIFFKLFVFENVFLASSIVKSDSNFVKYIVKAKIVFNKRL